MGGRYDTRTLYRVAEAQNGVVTRPQLLAQGMTAREIERRVERGDLGRIWRGVYLLGPIASLNTREQAAVLACSPRAVLSHRSAAAVLGLLPRLPAAADIEISVAGRNPGRRPDIRVHRVATLLRREVTDADGLAVTTAARTLLDLASGSSSRQLEAAIAEAFALRLTTRRELLGLIEDHPGQRGIALLRRQLDAEAPPARTRSRGEARLLVMLRAADLPRPRVNAQRGRWEIDFLWEKQKLAVEVDGYASHSSPWAFERDHEKTAELQDAGLTVLRISWLQLRRRPQAAFDRIARALREAERRSLRSSE